jgi:hypothetical protein
MVTVVHRGDGDGGGGWNMMMMMIGDDDDDDDDEEEEEAQAGTDTQHNKLRGQGGREEGRSSWREFTEPKAT